MNRAERRAAAAEMRKRAEAWPEHLERVPESEWPPRRSRCYPIELWRSRSYLVAVYDEPSAGFIDVLRLSINRVTIGTDGHWEQNIPWEDLMRCKREAGFADRYAVEIYPRDRDIVNVANMRHLWVLIEPLQIGWFDGDTRGAA